MASWFIRRLDRNETCYDDRRSVALRLISEGDATATSRGMSAAGPPSPPRPSAISWHCSASPSWSAFTLAGPVRASRWAGAVRRAKSRSLCSPTALFVRVKPQFVAPPRTPPVDDAPGTADARLAGTSRRSLAAPVSIAEMHLRKKPMMARTLADRRVRHDSVVERLVTVGHRDPGITHPPIEIAHGGVIDLLRASRTVGSRLPCLVRHALHWRSFLPWPRCRRPRSDPPSPTEVRPLQTVLPLTTLIHNPKRLSHQTVPFASTR
jgi:hypothetical protein